MEMIDFNPRRALLSVSDKRLIIELARALHASGIELVATTNTAAFLRKAKIPVTDVSTYTQFPELLNGRVKTLHPAIHAGLLVHKAEDYAPLERYAIKPFDLLIANLYPFEQTTENPTCTKEDALEHIDIGGPCMMRAAAKNYAKVSVIVSPDDYKDLITYLSEKKAPIGWNYQLAKKVFALTAAYDAAIASYFSALEDFPTQLNSSFKKVSSLRYGENPHQAAALYQKVALRKNTLATSSLIQGKPLSYNNLLDTDAALHCLRSFSRDKPIAVIIKHGTVCGIAARGSQKSAYLRAYATDPISAYGGIIGFNRPLEEETAASMLEKQFVEVIIAPKMSEKARMILAQKPNIRVLIIDSLENMDPDGYEYKSIDGGLLVQKQDNVLFDCAQFNVVSDKKPDDQIVQDLNFAWQTVSQIKSNAIVLVQEEATLGIGGGQTSRIMSTRIAFWQAQAAGFSTQNAVMASDAFIPFVDNLQYAAEQGILALIQPGGSIRDKEIIQEADRLGMIMIFTGVRHFKH